MNARQIQIGLWINAIAWIAISGGVSVHTLPWQIDSLLTGLCNGLALFSVFAATFIQEKEK